MMLISDHHFERDPLCQGQLIGGEKQSRLPQDHRFQENLGCVLDQAHPTVVAGAAGSGKPRCLRA